MATRLRRLLLREISLVKRGANPGARVILHKSEEHMPNPLERAIGSLRAAFSSAITGRTPDGLILKSADDRMEYVDSQLEEFSEALAADEPVTKESPTVPEPITKEEPVDVLKGLPDEARTLIQKAQSDAADAVARATAAEVEVAKAREERAGEMRLTKATAMLAGTLAGDPAKLADVLKGLNGEQLETLETILKGAREQIAVGTPVTREIGKGGKAALDAQGVLITKTAEVRTAFPNLTEPQAISEVLKSNPELYEASLDAGKGA